MVIFRHSVMCWCCVGLWFGLSWWVVLLNLLLGGYSSVVGFVVWCMCFGSLMVSSFGFVVIMLVVLLFVGSFILTVCFVGFVFIFVLVVTCLGVTLSCTLLCDGSLRPQGFSVC